MKSGLATGAEAPEVDSLVRNVSAFVLDYIYIYANNYIDMYRFIYHV